MHENTYRQVPVSWAGRVRTGNRQAFEYVKDFEVSCRFNENLTRVQIYKEIEKTKCPLSRVVGLVLRPGGLADFTLKSKEAAVNFAQILKNLDSIKNAIAYVDSVVEVRIDFIPPGFPSEPISAYLQQNHGEITGTPIRIADRFNIQTGTRVFKMTREDLEENPIENDHLERNCTKKQNMTTLVRNSKLEKRLAKQTNEAETSNPPTTQEEAQNSFEDQRPTIERNEKQKMNENLQPTTPTNRDSGKRPLSDSSDSPTMKHRNKRKNSKGERDDSPSSRRDPEISSGTSDYDEVSKFQLFADPCCHKLIQKCT